MVAFLHNHHIKCLHTQQDGLQGVVGHLYVCVHVCPWDLTDSHPSSGRLAVWHDPNFPEVNAHATGFKASLPLTLICSLFRLLQFLQGRGQSFLSPVQLFLNELDASIESCHIPFGLGRSEVEPVKKEVGQSAFHSHRALFFS